MTGTTDAPGRAYRDSGTRVGIVGRPTQSGESSALMTSRTGGGRRPRQDRRSGPAGPVTRGHGADTAGGG
ncbi:hypothetical protein FRAHR75_400021 [Frankia sp. Hr75.2]|nr:hypothetical protein FRAHR75_400021 [Frankia sp. Hr75.2]